MVRNYSFVGVVTPSVIDTEYDHCNFAQPAPLNVGGLRRGVRLFPGDDTPRTFTQCNLVNCELPPGSTVIGGVYSMVEYNQVTGTETVTVDGVVIESIDSHSHFTYGIRNPDGTYTDYSSPKEEVVD